MTRATDKPLTNLHLSPTNEPFSQLVRQWERGHLDPNPPYQRDPVWTLDQKIELIRSILTGTPLPAIITNRRRPEGGLTTRYVIDGKQRLTTLKEWFDGGFGVPASWFPAAHIARTFCIDADTPEADAYGDVGEYVLFTGLIENAQWAFENHTVPVAEGRFPTERAEAEVYLRVNGYGTPQTGDDMARAARVAKEG